MSGKIFLETNLFLRQRPQVSPETSDRTQSHPAGHRQQQRRHQLSGRSGVLERGADQVNAEDGSRGSQAIRQSGLSTSSGRVRLDLAHGRRVDIQQRYRLSWYDSLIVSAARNAGCTELLTEDLQHGQDFGNLVVRNPFL